MQEEYDNVLENDTDLNKKIVKLGKLNELAYEDPLCLKKVPLGLVRNAKSFEFPQGNFKVSWDRLVEKSMPYILPHLC